jgi:hypothetical protein
MQTVIIAGVDIVVPPRCRMTPNTEQVLARIIDAGEAGISLDEALALRGKARDWASRYRATVTHWLAANTAVFERGPYGSHGGERWRVRLDANQPNH